MQGGGAVESWFSTVSVCSFFISFPDPHHTVSQEFVQVFPDKIRRSTKM
jgi:hypothetical protein